MSDGPGATTVTTQDLTHGEKDMKRTPRPLAAVAMVALIGLIGAGCGADAPPGHGTGASDTATRRDEAVEFAECVRDHGVRDFPDPDEKGEFVYGVSVSPAVFQEAIDACEDLEPPGALSVERDPGQRSAALRFAECMRGNGVEDFPDPVDGEPLIDTTRIASTDRPGGMSMLNAAIQTCRSVMDEALEGR